MPWSVIPWYINFSTIVYMNILLHYHLRHSWNFQRMFWGMLAYEVFLKLKSFWGDPTQMYSWTDEVTELCLQVWLRFNNEIVKVWLVQVVAVTDWAFRAPLATAVGWTVNVRSVFSFNHFLIWVIMILIGSILSLTTLVLNQSPIMYTNLWLLRFLF